MRLAQLGVDPLMCIVGRVGDRFVFGIELGSLAHAVMQHYLTLGQRQENVAAIVNRECTEDPVEAGRHGVNNDRISLVFVGGQVSHRASFNKKETS